MKPAAPSHLPRIDYLDGLRGLAIFLVIFYHAYTRWSAVLPYGDALARFPLFQYGKYGVQLFFLISGFVIFMTLERCRGLGEFIYKRWLRLFPAMLICSLLIYVSALWLPERPKGMPSLRDLLPGLTLIDPHWWELLFGSKQGQLEGSFWSLYVEFKFYLLAGLLYFRYGPMATLSTLAPLGFAAKLLDYYVIDGQAAPALILLRDLLREFGLTHFGWFCAGACFYLFKKSGRRAWLLAGTGLGFAFALDGYLDHSLARFIVVLVFVAALGSRWLQALLSLRAVLWLGAASYPLYLLHEQALVGLLIKLSKAPLGITSAWAAPVVLLLLALLAYLIATQLEPRLRRLIADGLGRRSARLPTRTS